jgi:hypothetical protein
VKVQEVHSESLLAFHLCPTFSTMCPERGFAYTHTHTHTHMCTHMHIHCLSLSTAPFHFNSSFQTDCFCLLAPCPWAFPLFLAEQTSWCHLLSWSPELLIVLRLLCCWVHCLYLSRFLTSFERNILPRG